MLRAGKIQSILNRLERLAARAPWCYSFISVLISFMIMLALFQPGFDTNDDAGMNMIAAGKVLTHQPDEHLFFTHAYIGLALKFLYTNFPRVPWYGLYLVATQILAHTIIGGLILSRGSLRKVYRWFAIWMMTVGLLFFVRLQFTTTAFLVGLGGVLLLWEVMRITIAQKGLNSEPASSRRTLVTKTLAGLAMMLLCVMIRWEIFQLWFVLALPVLAFWIYQQSPSFKRISQFAAVAIFTFLCGLGLIQAHYAYYNADPAWAKFYDYNAVRVFFNDTIQVRYTPETSEYFARVGWSENDLKMMQYWCFDDPNTYSYEQLKKVYEGCDWKTAGLSANDVAAGYAKIFKSREVQGLMLLTLALVLVGLRKKANLKIVAIALGFSICLLLGLTISSKILPPRVYLPVMSWPVVVAAWTCLAAKRTKDHVQESENAKEQSASEVILYTDVNSTRAARLAFCSLLLVIVGTIFIGDRMNRFSMRRAREIREFKQQIAEFKPRSDQLYVMWATVIPIENIDPLGDLSWLSDFHAAMFGWTQNTPIMEQMKHHYGVENILREWQRHPELVFLGNDRCFELFKQYSREHLDIELQLVCDERQNIYGSPATYFRPSISHQADTKRSQSRSAKKQHHVEQL